MLSLLLYFCIEIHNAAFCVLFIFFLRLNWGLHCLHLSSKLVPGLKWLIHICQIKQINSNLIGL